MKKLIVAVVSLFFAAAVFAQTIPEGRKLFVLAGDFATDYENSWDYSYIKKFDVINDVYVISGYTVNKNIIGYMRQSYTVTITGENDGFTVVCSDMKTASCDKDGNLYSASSTKNPNSSMKKLAGMIKDDLDGRISDWTDEEYEAKLNSVVTNTIVLGKIQLSSTELYMKKFLKDYSVIGRSTKLSFKADRITESEYNKDYAYQINAALMSMGVDKDIDVDCINLTVYTNNDNVITMKPGDLYECSATISNFFMEDKNLITLILEEN